MKIKNYLCILINRGICNFMIERIRAFVFTLLFVSTFAGVLAGNVKSDSLLSLLSGSSTPAEVLSTLKELSAINKEKPEEVYFLKLLLNESLRHDSIRVAYSALFDLARHCYNIPDTDSLTYWVHYTDSIVNIKKDNPDTYYDVHSLMSKDYIYQGYYDLAIDEAVKLQKRAQETQHVYGMVCSSETLGVIYQESNRDSLAVMAFQDALNRLEDINGDLYYRIYLISNQIRSILSLDRPEELKLLLEKYEEYLNIQDELNKKSKEFSPINKHRWLLYSFYVEFYLQQNEMKKAKWALDRTEAYACTPNLSNGTDFSAYYYHYVQAHYYKKVKNYPRALAAIDIILKNSLEPDMMQLKIDIMFDDGKYEEATNLYKKMLRFTLEKNDMAFSRQVNQFQTLYNVNDKELQARELVISNMMVHQKQFQFLLSLFVLLVLLVLLYSMFRLLKRSGKLKNELLADKQSLIESGELLYQAKVKAEKASRMKSAFIANISHEIRTPLNAIVGFSSLLAESGYEEEDRNEFILVINKNSDILLNLINDVLDLSRMEAGSLKFVFKPCELVECCKEALSSVEHRVMPEVKLTLTSSHESFVLQTDPLRLQQLLLNLLSNAAKFTQQGEINLTFVVDDEKRQVKFIVTDSGPGIPLDKQFQIFERFEKLDEYAQGTGLGLSICRIIANRLGGSVSIDSAYTGGARFIFIHPYDISHLKCES